MLEDMKIEILKLLNLSPNSHHIEIDRYDKKAYIYYRKKLKSRMLKKRFLIIDMIELLKNGYLENLSKTSYYCVLSNEGKEFLKQKESHGDDS